MYPHIDVLVIILHLRVLLSRQLYHPSSVNLSFLFPTIIIILLFDEPKKFFVSLHLAYLWITSTLRALQTFCISHSRCCTRRRHLKKAVLSASIQWSMWALRSLLFSVGNSLIFVSVSSNQMNCEND
uniref:Uncharacterized protein n=1 Tax=Schistocephalus solidus TaxID=70667 RepID=A0A0V0J5C2_SCHSO